MITVPKDDPPLVSQVRVQIGNDWTAHHFGKPVPREVAAKRARQILEALT